MNDIPITTKLQLPFHFSVTRLQNDLQQLLSMNWIPHFNKGGYDGAWNSIPLYAPNGDGNNIYAFQKEAPILPTPTLAHCPYFIEVLENFHCPILTARLLKLEKGAIIKTHCDHMLGYEDHQFRIHIPIQTNPDVSFMLDGTPIIMQEGECWYTNVNYPHSVANHGENDRIHLVIDLERNDWTDKLFFSLAPKESFREKPTPPMDKAVLERMIDELRLQNNDGAKQVIKDLQQQLKNTADEL